MVKENNTEVLLSPTISPSRYLSPSFTSFPPSLPPYTLDGIDGKQARRTASSTPLGEREREEGERGEEGGGEGGRVREGGREGGRMRGGGGGERGGRGRAIIVSSL